MHISRIVIGYRSTLCLGLGVSALDRISKRPNLKDQIERSANETNHNILTQYLHDVRDVCFRSKNVKIKDLK